MVWPAVGFRGCSFKEFCFFTPIWGRWSYFRRAFFFKFWWFNQLETSRRYHREHLLRRSPVLSSQVEKKTAQHHWESLPCLVSPKAATFPIRKSPSAPDSTPRTYEAANHIPKSPFKWLAGGFKHLLFSARNMGKWSNLTSIFLKTGWFNHQLDDVISIISLKLHCSFHCCLSRHFLSLKI